MSSSSQSEHIISYKFRLYRCQWLCSCGKGSKPYTTDTYLGAHRKAMGHLEKVGGDTEQKYQCLNGN